MRKLKNMCRYLSVLLIVAMLDISMVGPAFAAEVTGAVEEKAAVDLNGTYHATLGVQTCTMLWISRWGYYDEIINPAFGTDKNAILNSGSEKTKNYVEYAGTFNDATIEGNGTYTVSLTGADFAEEVLFGQMHIATDIPVCDEITFSNIIVKINNRTLISFDEAFMESEKKYLAGGMVILAMNHWRKPLEDMLIEKGLSVTGNGVECLIGGGDDTIELTFTVSGFAYDKVEEVVAETVSVTPTVAALNNEKTDAETDTETDAETVAEADAETVAETDAETVAETVAEADEESGSLLIIIIVVGLVVIAAVTAAVAISKKKKHN